MNILPDTFKGELLAQCISTAANRGASGAKWLQSKVESQDLENTILQALWIYTNEDIIMFIFSLMLCSLLYINIKVYLYPVISSHTTYQYLFWISRHHYVDMIKSFIHKVE